MTWQGNVVSVHLATEAGAPMASPASIEAIAGKGVQGDRYCKGIGHFSHNKGARRQITLFESEVLETLLRDHNIELEPDECRMNIVTQRVPLTHLMTRRRWPRSERAPTSGCPKSMPYRSSETSSPSPSSLQG